MAGSYCKFCGRRCFVYRHVPNHPHITHLATCQRGKEYDREQLGYDADTAINPHDHPSHNGAHTMSIIQRIEERMIRAWHDKGPHHVPTVLTLTSEEANALRTELGFDKDDRHQILETGYQITTECGTVLATPENLVQHL